MPKIIAEQKSIKIDSVSTRDNIVIKGARTHNLKNIDLVIPKNKLITVTGVSGSGKSSLTIDTLYAEGQRRYVESLSAYARQFLVRMDKPDIEYIKGICPAIALEQKVNTKNPRSTIGTSSEIYYYLRLLYATIGKTISPVSGQEVKKHNVSDVVDYIHSFKDGEKVQLVVPFDLNKGRPLEIEFNLLLQKGFSRFVFRKQVHRIEDFLLEPNITIKNNPSEINVLIDRFVVNKEDADNIHRIADSVQTAFYEGKGICIAEVDGKKNKTFSNKFELDGISIEEPNVHLFSFNSPYGVCQKCEGFGSTLGVDMDLIVPDKSLSIYQNTIACWRGEKMKKWNERLIKNAAEFDFPIHKPYFQLSKEQKQLLWDGNKFFKGLNAFFNYLDRKKYKIQYRVLISRYRGKMICPECDGSRLRKESDYVKIDNRSISELLRLSIDKLLEFINNLKISKQDSKVSARIILEITQRLRFLIDVGLEYLTLNRASNTLSGGESQRINLAKFLGSHLISSLYILDEPSIGLHPRDIKRLIGVLKSLRDLGNTVVVVEHDEDTMLASDYIIDMGPLAGEHGGEVVFAGKLEELKNCKASLTRAYLEEELKIFIPSMRRKWSNSIQIHGACQYNLKNLNVKFPLNTFTVITGVSGSGKTTLLKKILYPALKKIYEGSAEKPGTFEKITGDIDTLTGIQMIDQNPIGRSSRSNPVTYIKAYDAIRQLYARQQLAKIRGYKPYHFSFNVEGGRCDLCKGEGEIVVDMQFMADVHLICESCNGRRFKQSTLDITVQGKSIADVLEMPVEEAIDFFHHDPEIVSKLIELMNVGLGYIRLGQSSITLSGGEAQRVKLASILKEKNRAKASLFIFDEPTTGLHFHDIKKLLDAFNALIEQGHSIIVIEHNLDIIKSADWIIDLGPDGGEKGGFVVFEGTPEDIIKCDESYTGKALKRKLIPINN